MQYVTLFTAGALALACLAAAIAIGRARKSYGEGDQPALFCALLGFGLTTAAAATAAMRYGVDPSWQAAHLWLNQAGNFLALPLLGAAALALGRGWTWSRPNWGRILLGLCAFFELFRQMNLLDDYRLALHLATLALLMYAGAVQWPRRTPLAAAAGAVALLLGAGLLGTEGFIGPLRRLDLFYLLLIPAYPLLAWLLLTLPGGATESHSPQAA